MKVGPVSSGGELRRLLEGCLGLVGSLQPLQHLPAQHVGRRVVGLRRDDVVGLLQRFVELAGEARQLPILELRLEIRRIETRRLAQLPVALRQLVLAR